MCAANSNMVSKVSELMELRKMIEDLTAEADLIADEIKAYMGDEETMTAGSYVVRYQNVVSQRCNTKELKKLLGDALDPFMTTVQSRRFSVK
ncbi:MAG: hypothetical protein Q4C54_09185 [Clostridia bacterium]|nr:hypothetical protein [Clostridia bacterium]